MQGIATEKQGGFRFETADRLKFFFKKLEYINCFPLLIIMCLKDSGLTVYYLSPSQLNKETDLKRGAYTRLQFPMDNPQVLPKISSIY